MENHTMENHVIQGITVPISSHDVETGFEDTPGIRMHGRP